jgi:hypothetical protein
MNEHTGNRTKLGAENLQKVKMFLIRHPEGVSDQDVARELQIGRMSAFRYRQALGDAVTEIKRGQYTVMPSKDDVADAVAILARAGVLDSMKDSFVVSL